MSDISWETVCSVGHETFPNLEIIAYVGVATVGGVFKFGNKYRAVCHKTNCIHDSDTLDCAKTWLAEEMVHYENLGTPTPNQPSHLSVHDARKAKRILRSVMAEMRGTKGALPWIDQLKLVEEALTEAPDPLEAEARKIIMSHVENNVLARKIETGDHCVIHTQEAISAVVQALRRSVPPIAAAAEGHCERPTGCVCGGDLPRVREGCVNWVKP